tara:strand:+ start:3776 stop:7198 length:3423 start_codon:yes stop_codon:yes gene_type:complete
MLFLRDDRFTPFQLIPHACKLYCAMRATKTTARVLQLTLLFTAFSILSCTQKTSWGDLNSEFEKMYQQGDYSKAAVVAEKSLTVAESTFGPDHANVATSFSNLAMLHEKLGNYKKAEQFYSRSLAIREKALGPHHLDTALSLNNLAVVYNAQGRNSEAEVVLKRALAIREEVLGPIHLIVGHTLSNLAAVYHVQGKHTAALPLLIRAVEIREEDLGSDHPDVATSLFNLALLYQSLGNDSDAERLHRRALMIREKILNPDDVDLALSQSSLAEIFQSKGKFPEAVPLFRRAAVIGEKALGINHPFVIKNLNNLAVVYYTQGNYSEAEGLFRRVLEAQEKALGLNHPFLVKFLKNLAAVYYGQFEYSKAEPLYKRILVIKEKIVGLNHPDLLPHLNDLALLYRFEKNYGEAESLLKRSLEIWEENSGWDDDYVAAIIERIVKLYNLMGKQGEVSEYRDRAKQIKMGGRATVFPQTATVGQAGTWNVSFILESDSMAVGGAIKVRFVKGFKTFYDYDRLQHSDPAVSGYVEAATSNVNARVAITEITGTDGTVPWDWDRNVWVVTARLQDNTLSRGDTITVVFGGGSESGKITAELSAFVDSILIAYDLFGKGFYREVLPRPLLRILPGTPNKIACYLPSTISSGKPQDFRIVVLDEYHNLATSFTGMLALSSSDSSAVFPETVHLSPADKGRKIVTVSFTNPGIHRMKITPVEGVNGTLPEVFSNPSEVMGGTPDYGLFWGDLHSHSSVSFDGIGTDGFRKARDVSCLDFYALTDHTIVFGFESAPGGINPREWKSTKRDVVRYYEPGKFVTFLGCEFSAWPPSGHHNIYFNAPDELIPDIPLFRRDDSDQIQNVWELTDMLPLGTEMITVPHHTGIIWNQKTAWVHSGVSFGNEFGDEKFRPLIEVYSLHGMSEYYDPGHPLSYPALSEYSDSRHPLSHSMLVKKNKRDALDGPHYAQDAWAAGEFLGVIASSDDHTTRPGLPYAGLAAVYSAGLTRDAVFDALKNRRTYGTTGQRMILRFEIDGQIMGSHVSLQTGKFPEIHYEVYGTDDLDFVEVLRWDSSRRKGHPVFEIVHREMGQRRECVNDFVDESYSDWAVYYVRAKQKRNVFDVDLRAEREVWAWSSPIWVNKFKGVTGDSN